MTLGLNIGDVGACFFVAWLCIDWLYSFDKQKEAFMKALLNTVVNTLAVLWGLGGGETRHRQENAKSKKSS